MKHVYFASLCALFLLGFSGVSYADTGLTIYEGKDTYYQKETVNLMFSIPTPHPAAKATYFIVNEKTGKKTKLGKFNLDRMSAGFSGSFSIEQKPGTYHYLVQYNDGSGVEEYETDTFTVLSSKKTPKVEIESFEVTFARIPYNEQTTDQEYVLTLLSESPLQLSDVTGTVKAKCTRPVMLYEKSGPIKCSKKFAPILRMGGNTLDYRFHIDEDDLEKDVKLVLEYTLTNTFGKKLDKEHKTLTLSSEI